MPEDVDSASEILSDNPKVMGVEIEPDAELSVVLTSLYRGRLPGVVSFASVFNLARFDLDEKKEGRADGFSEEMGELLSAAWDEWITLDSDSDGGERFNWDVGSDSSDSSPRGRSRSPGRGARFPR